MASSGSRQRNRRSWAFLLGLLLVLAGIAPGAAGASPMPTHAQPAATPAAKAPVVITTAPTLPAGRIGVAYSKTLTASGGGPYTWSVTLGTLPAGLTLSPAGVISGTPTVGGSKAFTVKVVGSGGRSATKKLTLNIATVWVATTSLPAGTVGTAYSATLSAGGTGPFTWSIVAGSGTLPAGLTLAKSGVISGKPTVVGKKAFKVKVVGAGGKNATASLSITIAAAGTVTITTASLPSATVGTAYSATLAATGAGPFTWSLASGALPAGLTLDPATGAISGTPTTAGTASFTVKVVGAGGKSATKALSIAVTAPTLSITTTSLPEGTVGAGYAATLAAAGTGPFTWSLAAGTLPAGLTLNATTGAITGTPSTAGTSSFTVKVVGSGGSTATKPLSIVVAAMATQEDWTQSAHDAGRSGWAPAENIITAAKAASVHEEWSTAEGPTVVAGGKLYTLAYPPTDPGSLSLLVYNLADGTVSSSRAFTNEQCSSPTGIAIAGQQVIANCSNNILSLTTTAPHQIQWQTADTDPGQMAQDLLISGSMIVMRTADNALVGYRLSDGTRMWQAILPSGASYINDMAATSTTVVVAYNDRLRALNLSTGAQSWLASGVASSNIVIGPDGWVYTNKAGGVARYNASTGAAGWAVRPGTDIYRILGADNDTVYVWEAFFNFGPPDPSKVHALRASDGSVKWKTDVPSRIRSFAITGGVIWLTSTEIYSQGKASDLIGLNRTTGAQLKRISFSDNMYGVQSAAVGNGKVVIQQGGSAGGTEPHRTRVFGLSPALPTIDTKVLPLARAGQPYSTTLSASGGTAPYSWSLTSGTLPSGVVLSPAGTLSGTPTSTATASLVIKVTDDKGASRTVSLSLAVIAAATTPSWTTAFGGADNNAFEPAETTIGLPSATSLGYRYTFAEPNPTYYSGKPDQPLVVGNRAYAVGPDGKLRAWDTTGMTTNRPALWTTVPDPTDTVRYFYSGLSYSAGVLTAVDDVSRLIAVRASDGVILWQTDAAAGAVRDRTLADGGRVLAFVDNTVTAYNLTTGALIWTAPMPPNSWGGWFATDGSRVYVRIACNTMALNAATGAQIWATGSLFPGDEQSASWCGDSLVDPSPVIDQGTVYFRSYNYTGAVRASDGVLLWSRRVDNLSIPVVVGGVLYATLPGSTGTELRAYDGGTGDLLWSRETSMNSPDLSVAGDLLIAVTQYYSTSEIYGFDRTTGELVWGGGTVTSAGTAFGSATVAGGRLYVATSDKGIRVYGPPN